MLITGFSMTRPTLMTPFMDSITAQICGAASGLAYTVNATSFSAPPVGSDPVPAPAPIPVPESSPVPVSVSMRGRFADPCPDARFLHSFALQLN